MSCNQIMMKAAVVSALNGGEKGSRKDSKRNRRQFLGYMIADFKHISRNSRNMLESHLDWLQIASELIRLPQDTLAALQNGKQECKYVASLLPGNLGPVWLTE